MMSLEGGLEEVEEFLLQPRDLGSQSIVLRLQGGTLSFELSDLFPQRCNRRFDQRRNFLLGEQSRHAPVLKASCCLAQYHLRRGWRERLHSGRRS